MAVYYDKNLVRFVLEEMRECVEAGNFVVLQTRKNTVFEIDYNVTSKMKRSILLAIEVEDYFNTAEDWEFPDCYVHEFCLKYDLHTPEGNKTTVDIYVKFQIREEKDTGVHTLVLSLHEAENPAIYPFSRER